MNSRNVVLPVLFFGCLVLFLLSETEGARPDRFADQDHDIYAAALTSLEPVRPGGVDDRFLSTPFSDCLLSRNNCGSISPSGNSVFIADGAFNPTDSTIFFIDVPSGADGVFQIDPATCQVVSGTYFSVNGGVSQRGIGYDPEYHRIWVGGWNDLSLNQHDADPPYAQISSNYVGLAIAAIAVAESNDYLFVATNASPDMLYLYDIAGGTLGDQLGSWPIPWQSATDGYDTAGMGFDDDSGNLVMINQYGYSYGLPNVREEFAFDISEGPVGASTCELAETGFAWGIALKEDGDPTPTSYYSYTVDITGFAPPFNLDEYGIPLVYPPYDFVCYVNVNYEVEMYWTNAEEYDEVRIYRDDALIASLPGDATYYLDDGLTPGNHKYEVSGVIGENESSTPDCWVSSWGPSGVWFGFDSSGENWTAGGYADWEWGEPSFEIHGNAWETNIGANYYNGACGWLDSPSINLGPEGGWLEIETYTYVECSYDGWNVQMSLDNGASWFVIDPLEGYDQEEPAGSCDEGLGGGTNCGYGELETWNFDLTAYPHTTVLLRILFESDSSVAYAGLVIDNIVMYGGTAPSIMVQSQLLNPDLDGDGVRDVFVGDWLYYSATFVNLTDDPIEYGAEHFFSPDQSCPNPEPPLYAHFGPAYKGVLVLHGTATHYYRVRVPDKDWLALLNPWAVQVAAWECYSMNPMSEQTRGCFGVTLLPGWEPPPAVLTDEGGPFLLEEIEELLLF